MDNEILRNLQNEKLKSIKKIDGDFSSSSPEKEK